MEVLWFLVCRLEDAHETKSRELAISYLLKASESSMKDVARQAGFYAFALFQYKMISSEKLQNSLSKCPKARSALAWAVGEKLDEKEPPNWCWELALKLAADPVQTVRQQLATRLSCSDSKPFMGNQEFVLRLLETPLARDPFADLERLFQETARLAWYKNPLIQNAETLLVEIQKKVLDTGAWEGRQRIRETETLLTRLIEELDQSEAHHSPEPALDVYDKLMNELPDFGLAWLLAWST
jgi:hypothetical protein